MELKIGKWYLDTPPRAWVPYSLVKITGFRFNTVEFESHDWRDGDMTVAQFTQIYTREVTRRAEGPELAGNPNYRDYYTLDLCTCCFVALVNGEPCQCPEDDETCHPEGLMGKLEGEEITPGSFASQHESSCLMHLLDSADVPGDYECECERSDFSTSQCDGCGTYLAGAREKATGWLRRG
jgi:hypothetical protein